MQQIYLKRLTNQDITRSVSICTESVSSFWGVPLNAIIEYVDIKLCHEDNPSYFPNDITIHKGYKGEKDWRICGREFKSLYAHQNPEEGDIMCVKKNGAAFSLKIIKKGTDEFDAFSKLFGRNDNYVVVHSDNTKDLQSNLPHQKIVYGAPGTGKSYAVNEETKDYKVYRTTFHPDYDYASFVGSYKPIMTKIPRSVIAGETLKKAIIDPSIATELGENEESVSYKFVPQVFAKAYVHAWKNYLKQENNEENENGPVYLVIEEINRGNCAQIFGDLFQLLDRKNGFSAYPIQSDEDLRGYLLDSFRGLSSDEFSKVINGEELILPPNLFIRATMNTSDQSLFPMDSAFKRRWDWEYVPIKDMKKGWKIKFDDCEVDWWKFLVAINKVIKSVTNSADKQMGYFFVKAKDSVIDAEMFVNKVAFYLWNDVFKDCELDGDAFKITREGDEVDVLTFQDFFNEDGDVNEEVLKKFLTTLVPQSETALGEFEVGSAADGEA